jgi:hypothetical protein
MKTIIQKYERRIVTAILFIVCIATAATNVEQPLTDSQLNNPSEEVRFPPWLLTNDVYSIPDKLRKLEVAYAGSINQIRFAPAWDQTSYFMIGKIVVGLVLPESQNSNNYWSQTEIETVTSKAQESLDWWKSQADIYGIPLTFILDGPHVIETVYEPIEMVLGPPDQVGNVLINIPRQPDPLNPYPKDSYPAPLQTDFIPLPQGYP